MKVITTKRSGYVIKVDYYPYDETRQLMAKIAHWWEHPSRSLKESVKKKISNYTIGTESRNMLGVSLEERMKEGHFSFICYDDEPVAFAGIRIDGDTAFCHRLATAPGAWDNHRGIVLDVLIPFQIKTSYDLGCKFYKITFNEHRRGLYEMWRNKSRDRLKIKLTESHDLISKFEFLGKEYIYETDQYVCQLDLSRPDIEDFFNYQ
jgi:hypothetical protein